MSGFRWRGDELKRKGRDAQKRAIDATMAAAVTHAKENHPFTNRTGSAERSIQIADYAREDARGVVGRWGSLDIVYFRRLEFGFQGKDSRGRVYDQRAFPTLRPAAAAEYPMLAARLKVLGI